MTRYRKLPLEVDAFQWTGEVGQEDEPDWIIQEMIENRVWATRPGQPNCRLMIVTLEGTMRAEQGDWIVRGVEGEIYPVKPGIFAKTYEAVPETVPMWPKAEPLPPGTTVRIGDQLWRVEQ